jgi:ribulose kinase
MISGGAGQQDLVRQLLADSAGRSVVATTSEEPVLLGSAILGAVAGSFSTTCRVRRVQCRLPRHPTSRCPAHAGAARIQVRRVSTPPSHRPRD